MCSRQPTSWLWWLMLLCTRVGIICLSPCLQCLWINIQNWRYCCLSPLVLLEPNTSDLIISVGWNCIFSQFWDVKGQGANRFSVWSLLLRWHLFLHPPRVEEGKRDVCWPLTWQQRWEGWQLASLLRMLIPCYRAGPSRPSHLCKGPASCHDNEDKVSTGILEEHKHSNPSQIAM
jgi:hypothetical protein